MAISPERRKQIIWVVVIFLVAVISDQVSKALIMANIPANSVAFKPNTFFWFTHERNEGLVGGLFRNNPIVPFIAPVFATCVLLYLFRFLNPLRKLQTLAFGLIAGGAIGNIIDRMRLGSVTDFLQFHFYFIPDTGLWHYIPWKYYPAFNVADSCICVGVFLLIITWNSLVDPSLKNSSDTQSPSTSVKSNVKAK